MKTKINFKNILFVVVSHLFWQVWCQGTRAHTQMHARVDKSRLSSWEIGIMTAITLMGWSSLQHQFGLCRTQAVISVSPCFITPTYNWNPPVSIDLGHGEQLEACQHASLDVPLHHKQTQMCCICVAAVLLSTHVDWGVEKACVHVNMWNINIWGLHNENKYVLV